MVIKILNCFNESHPVLLCAAVYAGVPHMMISTSGSWAFIMGRNVCDGDKRLQQIVKESINGEKILLIL